MLPKEVADKAAPVTLAAFVKIAYVQVNVVTVANSQRRTESKATISFARHRSSDAYVVVHECRSSTVVQDTYVSSTGKAYVCSSNASCSNQSCCSDKTTTRSQKCSIDDSMLLILVILRHSSKCSSGNTIWLYN
jgi:hypothetical protein